MKKPKPFKKLKLTTGAAASPDLFGGEDEKHMAAALYLLTKAVSLRDQQHHGWPTIHACLRDAAMHCEAARLRWTKEAVVRNEKLCKKLFGDKR